MKEHYQRVSRALTVCTLVIIWVAPIFLFWFLGGYIKGLPTFEYLSVTFGICAWALFFGGFISLLIPKILDKD